MMRWRYAPLARIAAAVVVAVVIMFYVLRQLR